jgi:serine/threonine-protein kinase RsbW/stage II sporulation protein AB (anti-sigma F factor)
MTAAPRLWEVPATPDQVAPLRRSVTGFARDHGFDAQRAADVALAVSEALNNVVLHAYRDGVRGGRMSLTASLNGGGALVIVIEDDGVGLIPDPQSTGLGLGLAIMRRVTDALDLDAGERGGRVCLHFAH